MHPAYSVIVFTTSSGAGYGLLFWLSLGHVFGLMPDHRWMSFVGVAIALSLITVGLLASTLHLGHPERAFRALSQWRSSWLSREGVAAILTYFPAGLLALVWLFGFETELTSLFAAFAAAGAAVTVHCTGMIYASLRTIRQWNRPLTPAVYLVLSSATGTLLLALLLALFGQSTFPLGLLALVNFAAAFGLKTLYWRQIDADSGQYTAQMATGLGNTVRPLDPPHTQPNFVMREMGYQVARKHVDSLRRIVFLALFAAPAVAMLVATFASPNLAIGMYTVATLASASGVVAERWLFFAEAEHVSQLYYGASRA